MSVITEPAAIEEGIFELVTAEAEIQQFFPNRVALFSIGKDPVWPFLVIDLERSVEPVHDENPENQLWSIEGEATVYSDETAADECIRLGQPLRRSLIAALDRKQTNDHQFTAPRIADVFRPGYDDALKIWTQTTGFMVWCRKL